MLAWLLSGVVPVGMPEVLVLQLFGVAAWLLPGAVSAEMSEVLVLLLSWVVAPAMEAWLLPGVVSAGMPGAWLLLLLSGVVAPAMLVWLLSGVVSARMPGAPPAMLVPLLSGAVSAWMSLLWRPRCAGLLASPSVVLPARLQAPALCCCLLAHSMHWAPAPWVLHGALLVLLGMLAGLLVQPAPVVGALAWLELQGRSGRVLTLHPPKG